MNNNDLQQFLFHQGTLINGFEFMGCHFDESKGIAVFRVWAANADSISVVGDFNNWDREAWYMTRVTDKGLWEARVPNVKLHDHYKFCVNSYGKSVLKADPYAFCGEHAGEKSSIVVNAPCGDSAAVGSVVWTDSEYMTARNSKNLYESPINTYEAHIGSWRRNGDGSLYNYRQFADEIVVYLTEYSFTHLELMGIAEHPFDGSWGYQVTGYFAPTSRYGSLEDFAYLINKCHMSGISVILDWVPGHFPKDEFGLCDFDGGASYEPSGETRKEHKEWGTRCFDYGREEVQTFLISNAIYWLSVFHIDGLRVDAVASMLYLDYGRKDGEWVPNTRGGNENLDTVAFFQKLNTIIFGKFPSVMMIAEESTAWPMVTKPVDMGGLGFNFKWNMGWMNDILEYAKCDPYFRSHNHNKLTFSLSYAFSENYILPISHDEVVHCKGSLLNKMPGSYHERFAGFRNFLMNMYAHPGKKLLFMGTEFAQFDEWKFDASLDWNVKEYDSHFKASEFTRDLFKFYKDNRPMWYIENDWKGFEWIVADDYMQNVMVYSRHDGQGGTVICVFNFSPMTYKNYKFGAEEGTYVEKLHSEMDGYRTNFDIEYNASPLPLHGKAHSLTIDIAPLSGTYLVKRADSARKKGGKANSGKVNIDSEKKSATKAAAKGDKVDKVTTKTTATKSKTAATKSKAAATKSKTATDKSDKPKPKVKGVSTTAKAAATTTKPKVTGAKSKQKPTD